MNSPRWPFEQTLGPLLVFPRKRLRKLIPFQGCRVVIRVLQAHSIYYIANLGAGTTHHSAYVLRRLSTHVYRAGGQGVRESITFDNAGATKLESFPSSGDECNNRRSFRLLDGHSTLLAVYAVGVVIIDMFIR